MRLTRVWVGTVVNTGLQHDNRRPVEFFGDELASVTFLSFQDGVMCENRGMTQTLYRIPGDRLVVYVEEWSKIEGEESLYTLVEVTKDELKGAEWSELLAYKAGILPPLSVDDVV